MVCDVCEGEEPRANETQRQATRGVKPRQRLGETRGVEDGVMTEGCEDEVTRDTRIGQRGARRRGDEGGMAMRQRGVLSKTKSTISLRV